MLEKVKNLTRVVSLTADGVGVYCALVSGGTVSCWGAQYDNGRGHTIDVPAPVTGLTNAKSLTSDNNGAFCALLSTGQVRCWGDDYYGELGNGVPVGSGYFAVPVTVRGITTATQLAETSGSFCALEPTGRVYCWGANASSELGDGLTNDSSVPIQVENVTNAVAVTGANGGSYCALLATHRIYCGGGRRKRPAR